MIKRISNSSGNVTRGPNASDFVLNISLALIPVITVPGTVSSYTEQDKEFEETINASFYNNAQVTIESFNTGPARYISSDESVATVDDTGFVTRQGNGLCWIQVKTYKASSSVIFDGTEKIGETTTETTGFVDGSLAKEVSEAVDDRLVGKNTNDNFLVYTSQDHGNDIFVRNPNVWCGDLVQQMTCISPSNSRQGRNRAGVAVTPRHVVSAAHYPLHVNDEVVFVTASGETVKRAIVQAKTHPDYNSFLHSADLRVYLLDSDLPESITPCKVFPDNLHDYMPSFNEGMPALYLDQEEKALATDYNNDSATAHFRVPTDTNRKSFYENKVGGDSGNPAFLIVDNELVWLTCATFGGPGNGSSARYYRTGLNQLIADVDALEGISTGYQINIADLSGYNSYA